MKDILQDKSQLQAYTKNFEVIKTLS